MAEQDPTAERWLPVVGYEGFYEVSDLGRVRSVNRTTSKRRLIGKMLSPVRNRNGGHVAVHLCRDGKRETRFVHWLVLRAFVGEGPDGFECDHINFDARDNRASNLRWISHVENVRHSYSNRRHATGERHPFAKLSAADVAEIRYRHASGEPVSAISRCFHVVTSCISGICSGKRRIG